MTEFAVALVNITDGSVQGHKAGCADLKRGNLRQHADDVWTLNVESKAGAWAEYNADFIPEAEANGESVESYCHPILWSPCAKHVPEGDMADYYGQTAEQAEPEAPTMTDAERNHARDNFAALAVSAPSEQGRAFWQAKADALA